MTIKAQLTLDDGEQTVSVMLSSTALATVAGELLEQKGLTNVLDVLSGHDDCAVRMAIASMKSLPALAIRRLAVDPALSVARVLLTSSEACKQLTNDEVYALCRRDPDLAEMVAGRYEDFSVDDLVVMNFLERHPDALVRESLAGNPFVPKPVLLRLAQGDLDSGVREMARQALT